MIMFLVGRPIPAVMGGYPGVWLCLSLAIGLSMLAGMALMRFALFLAGSDTKISAIVGIALAILAILRLQNLQIPLMDDVGHRGPILWLLPRVLSLVAIPVMAMCAILQTAAAAERSDTSLRIAIIGGLAAAIGFPTFIERQLAYDFQISFASLVVLLAGGACLTLGALYKGTADASEPGTTIQRHGWLFGCLCAAAASGFAMCVSSHIALNLPVVSSTWGVIVAAAAISLTLAAHNPGWRWPVTAARVTAISLAPFLYFEPRLLPTYAFLGLHALVIILVSLPLYRLALSAAHGSLRRFCELGALGLAVGASINLFLAPLIFTIQAEYPIMLALCVLLPAGVRDAIRNERYWALLPVALIITLFTAAGKAGLHSSDSTALLFTMVFLVPGAALVAFHSRPVSLCLGILALFGSIGVFYHSGERHLFMKRGFFGDVKVSAKGLEDVVAVYSGVTLIGSQRGSGPDHIELPAIVSKNGPVGDVFSALQGKSLDTAVASCGLGIGALACYAAKDEGFIFFEPDVNQILAMKSVKQLSYLFECPGKPSLIMGYPVQGIQTRRDSSLQLIVVNSQGPGGVPVEQMTVEALSAYKRTLRDDGLVLFILTNPFLDLEAALHATIEALGMHGLVKPRYPGEKGERLSPVKYLVAAKNEAALQKLRAMPGWRALDRKSRPWSKEGIPLLDALTY